MTDPRSRIILTPSGTTIVPAVGDLMAGPTPRSRCYRILRVTALRQAGKPRPTRYRLICAPAPRAPGATAHPWRLAPAPAPRQRPAEPAPIAPPARQSPAEVAAEQRARAARVGRDRGIVDGSDRGHSIRMADILSGNGRVLRLADVEIEEARDLENPNKRILRARRADPVHTLLKHQSLCRRQFEAMEKFRTSLEAAMPAVAGAGQSEVHVSPWCRVALGEDQVKGSAEVRDALATVPQRHRSVLSWMAAGGTIAGFMEHEHVHRHTAVSGLRIALDAVGDFFFGDGCDAKTCCRQR